MILETKSYGKVVIGWRYERAKKKRGRDYTHCYMRPYVPHGQEPRPLDIARVQIARDSRDQFVKSSARAFSLAKLLNSLPLDKEESDSIWMNAMQKTYLWFPV